MLEKYRLKILIRGALAYHIFVALKIFGIYFLFRRSDYNLILPQFWRLIALNKLHVFDVINQAEIISLLLIMFEFKSIS